MSIVLERFNKVQADIYQSSKNLNREIKIIAVRNLPYGEY